MLFGTLIFALLASFVATLAWYAYLSLRPKNFPPGPSPVPYLGNLHQLPKTKAFLKFHEWTKEYGSIIGLKFGPQNVIVLNNYRHVKELFDKRGGIYSSRPESYIGNELICPNDTHILLVPYGPAWRAQRKQVQALLNVTAVDAILPIQNAEASQTLYQLLKEPDSYYDHIRRYSTAVILASVFGQRGPTFDSPNVRALYHAQDQFTAILEPGATPPVDAFRFLRYLPEILAPWKTKAKAIRQEQRSLYYRLLDETKKRMERGASTNCFMEKMLQGQEKSGLDDEHIVYLGGILMEAGSDTTSSTLLSFILAMLSNRQALKAAQAEVDKVCGKARSPGASDVAELPYIRACMDETLRWRPVAAGGIPHVVTQDDIYEGYLIPKGTMLFANTWAIHRDPAEYADPDSFIPERFLNNKFGIRETAEKSEEADTHRRATYGFGAGRRVCSGQKLAENSLLVNMAKLVWAFDITTDDFSLVDTSVETGYGGGFLLAPDKFPVRFVPRSEEHARVIEREFEESRAVFERYEQ